MEENNIVHRRNDRCQFSVTEHELRLQTIGVLPITERKCWMKKVSGGEYRQWRREESLFFLLLEHFEYAFTSIPETVSE
jgi:hypothetical protein